MRAAAAAALVVALASDVAWPADPLPSWNDGPARKAQRWAGTDRQVRGRLLDVLRGAPGPVEPAAMDQACIDWARRLFAAVKPHAAGTAYVNFMPADEIDRVEAAYGGLPAQTLPATAARFSVELCLVRRSGPPRRQNPVRPRPRLARS